ncbi:Dol-P-Man:Man(5)GlcNAc(2)-PP-Dol alpha-1-3-mannosyltransferase [Penicillium macrosclerotiorum]|uniref:Dol-P-Man:Man(5)GlcNAc(2)-PP-Dol alpha-1-3-mannosyltransferase n=1 Tax=Penicillium macrosclerotiorum TaxID=303699 RepID=UPI0025485608|nr:Dol-P-Man:Man(5)GlcNAc(2)-PP-Dol alpha-1-3-mannosyltransferase [Penicillium macrosclerotiorum]KAJ5692027.1 Dol-P-Man:Man(5)GlcNAc(2)-PP-Dol alpha-1-3-mannosyltransferase [Penicillium macrosclerotiorum]
MSKLSANLKALINSPAARPHTVPAPANIVSVYHKIQQTAAAQHVSQPSWVALSTAATMTMNSPESLAALYNVAASTSNNSISVETAELMREVGLKCISFNGIPRTINCLNAFRAGLPDSVAAQLSRAPTRTPNPDNIAAISARGRALWDSIYRPFENKLYSKLAESHPDLPVHILHANYGALLSDPVRSTGASAGRVLTSIVAVACLRAQTGVGPQVLSHVFGLRKALEDGSWADDVETEQGARWLASDEGNAWILSSVDAIVEAISGGTGSNFAPGKAKL